MSKVKSVQRVPCLSACGRHVSLLYAPKGYCRKCRRQRAVLELRKANRIRRAEHPKPYRHLSVFGAHAEVLKPKFARGELPPGAVAIWANTDVVTFETIDTMRSMMAIAKVHFSKVQQ